MKFYFRVESLGKTKHGYLTAANKDTAFALLVEDGNRVLELWEATCAGRSAETPTEQTIPGPSQMLDDSQLPAPKRPKRMAERVLLAVALVGFLGFLSTWNPPGLGQGSEQGANGTL